MVSGEHRSPVEGDPRSERDLHELNEPDDRRRRLTERIAALKAKGVKDFLARIASEEGFTKSRLQQIVNRKPKVTPEAKGAIGAMAASLAGPISKGKTKA